MSIPIQRLDGADAGGDEAGGATHANDVLHLMRPGPLQLAALPPLSLYVHLPWCLRKCPYCDFNSHEWRGGPGGDTLAIPEARYLDAMVADLDAAGDLRDALDAVVADEARRAAALRDEHRLTIGFVLCAAGLASLSGLSDGDGWARLVPA